MYSRKQDQQMNISQAYQPFYGYNPFYGVYPFSPGSLGYPVPQMLPVPMQQQIQQQSMQFNNAPRLPPINDSNSYAAQFAKKDGYSGRNKGALSKTNQDLPPPFQTNPFWYQEQQQQQQMPAYLPPIQYPMQDIMGNASFMSFSNNNNHTLDAFDERDHETSVGYSRSLKHSADGYSMTTAGRSSVYSELKSIKINDQNAKLGRLPPDRESEQWIKAKEKRERELKYSDTVRENLYKQRIYRK